MRKIVLYAAVALIGALSLSACQKQSDQTAPQAQQVARPTSPTDAAGWKNYLVQVVTKNMQGMTANQPYMYYVPAGADDASVQARQRQLENVSGTVARGVLPGNLMAFGGPDSSQTAQMIITAFKDASPGSFKGVIVLFVGDQADEQGVAQALQGSAATFRFVQM
ncbi:MAG: hypothetical protein KGI40_04415 [Xanthomonadaceae bacterium]|nr:hypothetical protein [Xanthomonadaceae bacterium]MDE1958312.1 hypothetical protein [Xanthomonadaceae bacterium]MDE2178471.1 hypothetical protein [Xanthomonadaceae bacterium]MDE2245250.1 hypothetical protein [Xanthomonadaceae bacterium]